MKRATNKVVIGRRAVIVGCGSVALFGPSLVHAELRLDTFDGLFQHLTRRATPVYEGLELNIPDVAENGNTVPFKIRADSPMTDDDYVAAIHLLATKNPHPHVASFRFTPASGLAQVSGRMRLLKSQEVVAIADTNKGLHRVAKKVVEVTIGGCGG